MFHAVITQRADFLVRFPKDGLFQEARAFLARGKRGGKITVSPPKELLRENPHENYPPLTLRMVVVSLPGTAEDTVFITTHLWKNLWVCLGFNSWILHGLVLGQTL
jgi:hypothetical protein